MFLRHAFSIFLRHAFSISGSVEIGYDNNFWITNLSLRGAEGDAAIQISFDYDDDGLLTSAGDLSLTRDSNHGLITNTTLGLVTSSIGYTGLGELETEDVSYSGTSYYSVTFTRDDLGRIETETETVQEETHTYGYTYDTAGRLDTVTLDSTLTSDYSYDANGNRDGGTYDAQDRLTTYGSNTYTYTDNGELLTKTNGDGTTTYTYDSLGNLTNVSLPSGDTIEYIIDGANRRIGKKYNGTLMNGYLYEDQLKIIAELNGSDGSVESRFIYGSKANVPDYMVKDGTTYRIISDHLGSVRMVIDTSDGSIDQRMDYDEFGNVISDTSPGFQPFGFAGGLYDEDTGLVRFGARDYDAEVGRWTAKDPIGFSGGDTNLYGYVMNDPVNLIDSLGLRTEVIIEKPGSGVFDFGHVSVDINGTLYTYLPSGMHDVPANMYLKKVDATGYVLNISSTLESNLEKYLSDYKSNFNFLTNNCGDPLETNLESVGYDLGINVKPVSLGKALNQVGLVTETINYKRKKK